jgi:hypothetical protein
MRTESQIQRLFFCPQSQECGHLWGVWLHVHEGRHFLYFLGMSGATWDNISLAVSDDGVS